MQSVRPTTRRTFTLRQVLGALAPLLLLLTAHAGLLKSARAQTPAPRALSSDASAFFELRVRPLLQRRCVSCHGPAVQQSGLRLDRAEGLKQGGRRGAPIRVGDPEGSLLLRVVSGREAGLRMPPDAPLPAAEIADLGRWVRAGAVWPPSGAAPNPSPRSATEAPSGGTHWAFRPIRVPPPPRVKQTAWVKNPVDAFILARLEAAGMQPAPPASRAALLRRVTFDLHGLPPTPGEVDAFLHDTRPDAYERVVDRLLASPHYGERWGRHWLDLVRYADTNGYERDAEKPHSWKYRDYVIRSLNADKPYDRFLREQLAGDELPDRTEETVTATGFLRLGTWDDEPNDPLEYQYERLDDLVHVTSTTFLALTVRCARCHDHKYDPIPQRDYYALGAAFWGGYVRPGEGRLQGGPPETKLGFPVLGFTDEGPQAPPLRLLEKGDPRRPAAEVAPGYLSVFPALARTAQSPANAARTTTRRLQLADWLTDRRHPLTSRVLVNRVWQHHFGEALARTPNNFGTKGDPPTHPELLDWLAGWFAGDRGAQVHAMNRPHGPGASSGRTVPEPQPYRLKALHRLLVTSSTYRMSTTHPLAAKYDEKDSANRFWWHFPRRRLDADALRDALLAVSGELNPAQGGRGFVPRVEKEALEGLSRRGAEWNPSPPAEQTRRTVYMFLKRALIMPLLTTFDFGDTTQPLERRESSIVPPQALAFLNNPFLQQRADAFAGRLLSEAPAGSTTRVEQAWRLAFARRPTPAERDRSLELLRHLERRFAASSGSGKSDPTPAAADPALLSDLALWLRADRGVERDADGRVQAWRDARGQGYTATQLNPQARPHWAAEGAGRHPAIRFDGRGNWLGLPEGVLTSPAFTVLAVVTDRGGPGHREIFSNWRRSSNVGSSVFLGTTGPAQVRFSDAFAPAGALVQPAELHALTAVTEPAGAAVFQNRQVLAERAGGLPDRKLTGPYVIGQQGDIQGEFWNGELAELLVFNRALSVAERTALWNTLAARYDIMPAPPPPTPTRLALRAFCHALFNTNEFLFAD